MEELCRLGEQILDTLQNNVDLAIAHTDYVYDDLRRRGYRFIRKIPIIVDTSRFTGEGSPEWEPLLHSLEYLIFVGRIVPQKDLMLALKVFAELHRRRPHLILFLVGPLHIPKYAAELTQLAEELRIVDSVVFVGRVTEPAVLTSFYQHARYYLALSAWESFCVPIAESLYFGTPILGHAVPPIPETMGLGGIILEGTPEHMAAQIDARWEIDDTYQQLQKAGYAHAAQFTEPALRAALLEVFRTLAEWR